MGKTRDDNIVITGAEKIIQDGYTIIDSDKTGNFDTVNVATKLTIPTVTPSSGEVGLIWIGDPIPQPGPTRGVFGGGYHLGVTSVIDYVTISSTGDAAVFGDLTDARYALAGTSNGTNDRGVFGGGYSFTGPPE